MKIHHIGYVVRDITKSITEFKRLGFVLSGKLFNDTERKVRIQLMRNENYTIELVSPLSEQSPVFNILTKNNETPYHICFCTDCMNEEIRKLRKQNYLVIEKPNAAIAFNGKKVAFLYHKYIGLIELLECK